MDFFVLSVVRFATGLIILRLPLIGVALSIIVDGYDWGLLHLTTNTQIEFYRVWDKLFDLYFLGLAALVSLNWREKTAKVISLISYFGRVVGVLLFIFFNQVLFLVIFPNFFETFFVFYLVSQKFLVNDLLFTTKRLTLLVVAVLFLPRLWVEYLFHIKNLSPFEQLFKIGSQQVNSFAFILTYLSLPLLVLVWLSFKRSR